MSNVDESSLLLDCPSSSIASHLQYKGIWEGKEGKEGICLLYHAETYFCSPPSLKSLSSAWWTEGRGCSLSCFHSSVFSVSFPSVWSWEGLSGCGPLKTVHGTTCLTVHLSFELLPKEKHSLWAEPSHHLLPLSCQLLEKTLRTTGTCLCLPGSSWITCVVFWRYLRITPKISLKKSLQVRMIQLSSTYLPLFLPFFVNRISS